MRDKTKSLVLQIINTLNVLLITAPIAWAWFHYYARRLVVPYYNRGNWIVVLIFAILYVIFSRIYDGFSMTTNRISETVYSQGLAIVLSDFLMFLIITLLSRVYFPKVMPLLRAFVLQLVISVLLTWLCHKWYYATFPPNAAAVVYDSRPGLEELIREYRMEKEYRVEQVLSVEECLENLDTLQEMDTVFLSGVHSHERNLVLKYCVDRGIDAYVIPRIGDVIVSGASRAHMFHLPVLRVGRYNPSLYYQFAKRLADILISGLGILVLSPLFLITALAIKLYDGGPVLYKQKRLTKDGKIFNVLKFRSMKVDAEKDGVARLSTGESDDRITPVGRIIRKVRLDELPQLFCILAGDMAICGPRPERPEIAAQYEKTMPEFRLRLQTKAGLTGYAQVYGKYNTTPYDKLLMDLMYIAHPSVLEDLRIIFATIKILFQPESTEGVAAGQVTAAREEEKRDGE